jgi:O-antigen/teichoic acid export membrane protein
MLAGCIRTCPPTVCHLSTTDAGSLNLASRSLQSRSWVPHLKEASWVAIGQIAAAAGALLAIKVCTNVLDPAEFGRFSAVLAIAGLGQACFFGPVSQSATRFLSVAREQDMLAAYWFSLIKLYLLGAFAAITCGLVLTLSGLGHLLPMPAPLIVLYTLAVGLQTIQLAAINAARLRKWVAGLQIADALLRPTLVLAVAFLAAHSSSDVISSYILTSTIIIAASGFLAMSVGHNLRLPLSQTLRALASNTLVGQMSSFTLLFVIFGVLGAVGSHGERLLLIDFVSWSDIGIYALLMQLAMAPYLVMTNLINQYYLPVVFHSDPLASSKLGRSYQYYLAINVLGVLAIAVCVAALGRWIVPLFSNTAFLGHEHLLWYLALSAGVFNLGQQLVLPGMRENRLSVYLPSKMLHSVALLCLALLLVPKWGITGMALASMTSAVVYTLSVICANIYLSRTAPIPT